MLLAENCHDLRETGREREREGEGVEDGEGEERTEGGGYLQTGDSELGDELNEARILLQSHQLPQLVV